MEFEIQFFLRNKLKLHNEEMELKRTGDVPFKIS